MSEHRPRLLIAEVMHATAMPTKEVLNDLHKELRIHEAHITKSGCSVLTDQDVEAYIPHPLTRKLPGK